MKIAICMSGLTRTFKKCYQSYLDNIISHYDCDIFVFVSKGNEKDLDLINITEKIVLDKDPILDEKDYIKYKAPRTKFYSVQGWLQQFWKIKMCNDMMINYGKKNNVKYDWVIRTRPDLMITRKIDNLNLLNKNMLYVPVYPEQFLKNVPNALDKDYFYNYADNYGYMPDQFAIGSMDVMEKYCGRYDNLDNLIFEKDKLFCAEVLLGRQLKFCNVKTKFIQPLIRITR